ETPAGTVTAWVSSFLLPELIDQIRTTFFLSGVTRDCTRVHRFGELSSCWTQITSQLPKDFSVRVAALAVDPGRAVRPATASPPARTGTMNVDGNILMPRAPSAETVEGSLLTRGRRWRQQSSWRCVDFSAVAVACR